MKNFVIDDFSGSGQYLVRLCPKQIQQILENKQPHLCDTGFLSTIMYKVGYSHGHGPTNPSTSCLISMADGWTRHGYIDKHGSEDTTDWEFVPWLTKQQLCDYLNGISLERDHIEEYRFATQEEVVRVVMSQKSRWRG
jgi:hypothetical protein